MANDESQNMENTSVGTATEPAEVQEVRPIPDPLRMETLQKMRLPELQEMARERGLRVRIEASRHTLSFDIGRAQIAAGGELSGEGVVEYQGSQPILRWPAFNFTPTACDVMIPHGVARSFFLRPGLKVDAVFRNPEGKERQFVVKEIRSIEGIPVAEWKEPPEFDKLTALFPDKRLYLENPGLNDISARAVDLIAPLGKGQRGLIVAPPRAGKTMMLKSIARAILANHPEVVLILLLIDERPEEVTDLRRELNCEIYSSTFDESPTRHVQVAELVSERAKRLVELKKDVVILLDSITRLSRGYNNLQPNKGRIMSGGVDAKALIKPKRFFGAARNVDEGGSLTILATALVETQSRMDDLIFEEYKGTGNMEVYLDRSIAEQRVFPAIHITKSATRRDELLYHPDEFEKVVVLRRQLADLPAVEAMEVLASNLTHTKSNVELLLGGLKGL